MFIFACNIFIVETDKSESRAHATIISTMICNSEHYPVRKSQFVVSIKSTLYVMELLWPVSEVNKLVILALSAEIDHVSLFDTPSHLLSSPFSNSSLLLLTKDRPRLILHKKMP